jgi:hypothetical protein
MDPDKIRITSLPPKGIPPLPKPSGDKIRISLDDVHSAAVDAQIKHQDAVSRAAEHVRRQIPLPISSSQGGNLFYKGFVYMTLFGLAGGIVAWLLGELVFATIPSDLENFNHFIRRENDILAKMNRGILMRDVANQALRQLDFEYRGNPYVAIATNLTLDNFTKQRLVREQADREWWHDFFRQGVWLSFLGSLIGLSLAVAESAVNRNVHGVIVNGSIGALLGLIGGILVSTFINSLYNAIRGNSVGPPNMGLQIAARTIGWGILGLFIAIAPGIVLRNYKRMAIGIGGGLLGGLAGGLLFDPIGMLTDNVYLSRFVAVAAIGMFAGLGTGILEDVAKSGWLLVSAGLIAGKQFVLYRNPTTIGSSPQCEVYLFKDADVMPQHALVHVVGSRFELEDLHSATGTFVNGQPIDRVKLRHGDQIQIGETAFTFQERARTS